MSNLDEKPLVPSSVGEAMQTQIDPEQLPPPWMPKQWPIPVFPSSRRKESYLSGIQWVEFEWFHLRSRCGFFWLPQTSQAPRSEGDPIGA